MEISGQTPIEETKKGIFNKLPKAFRVVIGVFLIIIIVLMLLVVIRGSGKTKDVSVSKSDSSGNTSGNQNVLISTDSEIVVSNFLEALKTGNKTEADKYLSEKANRETVNKLFDGSDKSLLGKNFNYEFINKYEEKTGTIIRITAKINYNQTVSYYTFSLLRETVESNWFIANVEFMSSQQNVEQ